MDRSEVKSHKTIPVVVFSLGNGKLLAVFSSNARIRQRNKAHYLLSGIAKLLLVITSMAPVLGAFAIIDYMHDGLGWQVFRWVVAASGLLIICLLVLHFARHQVEIERLTAKKIKSADKEVLAFLLAYLLPLLSKDHLDFKAEWVVVRVK